jgi:shikimate kinase
LELYKIEKHSMIIIIGVSGSGKTTIGKILSKKIDAPYFDADDFHPLYQKKSMLPILMLMIFILYPILIK